MQTHSMRKHAYPYVFGAARSLEYKYTSTTRRLCVRAHIGHDDDDGRSGGDGGSMTII